MAALSGLLDIRPVRTGSMMYLGEALLRTGMALGFKTDEIRRVISIEE